METIHVHTNRPPARILSEDAVDFVWVPEPLDVVQEREFRKRVNKTIKEKLPVLVNQKIRELQPNLQKEKQED